MVAAVAIGASVVGGVVSSQAASKASKAQVSAANQSNETERYIFDQQRQDQQPWQRAGRAGIDSLTGLYGFQRAPGVDGKPDTYALSANPSETSKPFMLNDPGYKFGLDEGQRNLENSAAARGGLLSGNFLKATTQYGQDYATNQFDKVANRYAQLAGVGQTANAAVGQAGQNYANAYGQNVTNAGNARASGYVAKGNAINGALNSAAGGYGLYKGGYFG